MIATPRQHKSVVCSRDVSRVVSPGGSSRRSYGPLVCFLFALVLSVCVVVPSGASAQGESWQTDSWMKDLFGQEGGTITVGTGQEKETKPASSVQLGDLAIPGSHDSTADVMGGFAEECEQAGWFQRNFGKGLTQRWACTQHHDLYTQAKLGVRSFDIRPYYDGTLMRSCHTLDAGLLRPAFDDLNRFVAEQEGTGDRQPLPLPAEAGQRAVQTRQGHRCDGEGPWAALQ